MAFFRFSRDKRGYEHFYLVEPVTNRKGKSRPRVLYWYRTPPNVKVGRPPFDAEMRRAIEAQYPDVTFDWTKIVEAPIPSADAEKWRERRRAERADRVARRSNAGADADEESEPPEETDHGGPIGEEPQDAEMPSGVTADAEPRGNPADRVSDVSDAGDIADAPVRSADIAPLAADVIATPAQQTADGARGGRKRRRRRRGRGHPAPGASATPGSVTAAEPPADTPGSVADEESSDDPIDEPSGE